MAGLSGRLANTAITRESLGNLSAQESRAVYKAVTSKYAEQLKQDGVSQEHIDTYVKESEKNATSKEAADAHTASVVEEMNQVQRAQIEEKVNANVTESDTQPFTKERLSVTDIDNMLQNKTVFTNEQIGNMNEKQLSYALDALMPSFVEQTKNNKAFAEVPLLIEKAQKAFLKSPK